MRKAFVNALIDLAAEDPRVLLLTGDLGYMALEPFAEQYPDRFLNVGVAEQNMVGVATGLAEAGFVPFVYSIATFAALRPYEFIRNGPIGHKLPVRIVGMGGGFEYGPAGITHHAVEDLGVMRVQPELTVVAPADHLQTRAAVLATRDHPKPIYLRLGKNDKDEVTGLNGKFRFGRVELPIHGSDLLFIAVGGVALEAAGAAEDLRKRGVSCALAVVSSFNPDPKEDLARLLSEYPLAVTVEAHYQAGGLGSMVCETAAESGSGCRIVRKAIQNALHGGTGGQAYLHNAHDLSREKLVEVALAELTPF